MVAISIPKKSAVKIGLVIDKFTYINVSVL